MEKIQDIENIVNNKNDKLDLLYKTKLKNIKKQEGSRGTYYVLGTYHSRQR